LFDVAMRGEEDHEVIVRLGDATQPFQASDYGGPRSLLVLFDPDVIRGELPPFRSEQEVAYGARVGFPAAQIADLPSADFLVAVLEPRDADHQRPSIEGPRGGQDRSDFSATSEQTGLLRQGCGRADV